MKRKLKLFWRAVPAYMLLAVIVPFAGAQAVESMHSKITAPDSRPEQTFYLINATSPSDVNETTTALRNMLDPSVKVYLVPSQNAILIRATADQLQQAKKIISDLDRVRQDVVLDVVVLEMSKDRMRELGKDAAGHLFKDKDTHVLQSQQIRAMDGQRATLKIGSKIPVVSRSSSGSATTNGTSSGLEVQYLDIGMNIDVTPVVHEGGEISMKLKIDDSTQSGSTTIDSVAEPVILQGVVEQEVQLREGETSMVASSSKGSEQNEIVFLLTPHIVQHEAKPGS